MGRVSALSFEMGRWTLIAYSVDRREMLIIVASWCACVRVRAHACVRVYVCVRAHYASTDMYHIATCLWEYAVVCGVWGERCMMGVSISLILFCLLDHVGLDYGGCTENFLFLN